MEQNTAIVKTALVIGGGIAGPVTAMALRKAGIDAVVYEAYEQAADGVGGGMSLAPNGVDALDAIDCADLIQPLGAPMTGIVLQDWKGSPLAEFGNPPGIRPMQFVWRDELYRVLHDEAARRGVRIEHGKRLVRAEETADGVTAHFADGTRATADILIGCDGIRSTVRSFIDPAAPGPQYAGLISFGARVRDPGVPSTAGKMPMTFGKQAFFGYQVFGADDAVWFVNLPHPEPMTAAEVQATPAAEWLPILAEKFAGDGTPARDLIERTDPSDVVIVGPMENMPPTTVTWSQSRIVLVGDAVHAPSSSSGQGASLSIESAIQLARCLRDLPYAEAFAAYEAERRPRVERVIKETTRKNAGKAAGPVGRVVNAYAIRIFGKLVKPEKMSWIFDYRIDWETKVTG
ncbi:NAD(P)/FAD-dependent oxidoreductase [Nonomuraea sp. NEAU-A123]|uniref:FAD-dependent oxidoreductase n=1 Tax=Nonomuraea sp. NEAU-A123 TaxID=2839649 RepID=UPI001BE4B9DC|nr:FAD-dependent monooxygenase [Nonomuraea sp. NEAU-A123]MBT2232900.1 FAD-dependent monooxygenase [Nonomuraea sp. NEAU-A123]